MYFEVISRSANSVAAMVMIPASMNVPRPPSRNPALLATSSPPANSGYARR